MIRWATVLTAVILAAPPAEAQMTAPNPYRRVEGVFAPLPNSRAWGATSAVYPARDGKSLWVGERCSANLCVGSPYDPIFQIDTDGRILRHFGAGLFAWPHSIYVDAAGDIWVTDAVGYAPVPPGIGHVIYKFSPDGRLLMTLGKKGVAGKTKDTFNKPSAIVVAADGSLFVADGHDDTGNNRIVKLSAAGVFIKEWGGPGLENGEFRDPHALAFDSKGRLFVADRANSRIQIFDQEGKHLATWTQFGRPSGLFIDQNDVLYATDSESNAERNPGWKRGIYIGSAATGWVTHFIPDPEPDQDNSGTSGAEGIAVDAMGNIYGAEVGPKALRKYIR